MTDHDLAASNSPRVRRPQHHARSGSGRARAISRPCARERSLLLHAGCVRDQSKEAFMNSRHAWPMAAVAVGTFALALGCAPQQREVETGRSETIRQTPAPLVGTSTTSVTTTTSAPVAVTPGI